MDELVKAARCMSDSTRVRVLHMLMQRECCVCEVMDLLGISQVNASRYCNALREAGFLSVRRDGRWKHYSVAWDGCSPALRNMLEAVREAGETDSRSAEDRQRLGLCVRRCVIPSPSADICDACNARVAGARTVALSE